MIRRHSCIRIGITLLLLGFLSACNQGGTPVPTAMKSTLLGYWDQVDGSGFMRFYEDDTVKIDLPGHTPPIRIISSYELLKREKIGIDSGEVWSGPLVITLAESKKALVLNIPGKEATEVRFRKRERN